MALVPKDWSEYLLEAADGSIRPNIRGAKEYMDQLKPCRYMILPKGRGYVVATERPLKPDELNSLSVRANKSNAKRVEPTTDETAPESTSAPVAAQTQKPQLAQQQSGQEDQLASLTSTSRPEGNEPPGPGQLPRRRSTFQQMKDMGSAVGSAVGRLFTNRSNSVSVR